MVKTLKNLLQNQESFGAESWYIALMIQATKFVQMMTYIDLWPFYNKVKFATLYIYIGKMLKKVIFSNCIKD